MADTAIEWTERSWNPIVGRSVVSPGCTNCYAMAIAERFKHAYVGRPFAGAPAEAMTRKVNGKPVWTGQLTLAPERTLLKPLRRRKPTTFFVNSMGDLFHEAVPDEWIDRVFAVMALTPQHTYQVLTKRSARMRAYLSMARAHPVGLEALGITLNSLVADPKSKVGAGCVLQGDIAHLKLWPLPNVWLGVSAEDQRRADERIPDLLATPAAIRFVSAEPLLGPIDFEASWHGENALYSECWGHCAWCEKGHPPLWNCQRHLGDWERGRSGLDWVIVGGESGPGARPMHPDWARQIRDQCAAAGTAFFFKQWGEWIDEQMATAQHCAPGPQMFDRFGAPKGPKWHPYDAGDRNGGAMIRLGKKAAGRLLDGVQHDALPEARR